MLQSPASLQTVAFFVILSLGAAGLGFITASRLARRIALVLSGALLLVALALLGFFFFLDHVANFGALPATRTMFC